MKAWLQEHWEWLCAALFIAVTTSTVVGFKEGSRGTAIFVANAASAIMAIVLYPLLYKFGYGIEGVFLLGLFCGACGTSVFGVLIALRNLIDRRKDKLAGAIIDRVVPETKDP